MSSLTFTVSINFDGDVHEASVASGETFGQAALRFLNKFDGLKSAPEGESKLLEIANVVAKGMSNRFNALSQDETADRIIASVDVMVESRQTVLTRSDKQTPEQAALFFVKRNGLNKNVDVDLYLRMFVRQLNILAGLGQKPLLVDAGVQAVFPITLSLSDSPDASAQYNFYIVQGETVDEAVIGFMARMGLDATDEAIRADLAYAAQQSLARAEEARQLKSGQGSPRQQFDQTTGGNGRIGDAGSGSQAGLSGSGVAGSGASGTGGQASQVQGGNVITVEVAVDGRQYTLEAGMGDDPFVAASQFFDAIASDPFHQGLLALSAEDKRDFLLAVANGVAKKMNPVQAAPVEQKRKSGVFDVAPFATRIPLIIGKGGADVEIDAGTDLATLASVICKDERERYLQEKAALLRKMAEDLSKDRGAPIAPEPSEDAFAAVFESADGVTAPVCTQLVYDIFQKWYTAEAAERLSK